MRAESCSSVQITCRPPSFGHARAELDVGAAAGHVRGDRDFARLAGVGDDFRFFCDLVGVEHLVLDAGEVQQARQNDRFVDRARADQHRPALLDACREFPATIACHFSSAVPKTRSGSRFRCAGRFVGTGITTL